MKALIPERVRTRRLIAERLDPDHEPFLARLALDPRVYPTLWPFPHPPTEADVQDGLRRQLTLWERHGFGLWLLRDRATGEFVGRGGLEYTDAPGRLSVEVAWAIVPERWGQGLATELGRAAVRTGFQELDLTELVALTLPHNAASRRVMEKVGFTYDREIFHAGLAHVLYRLGRPPDGGPAGAAEGDTPGALLGSASPRRQPL
ncbi:MAG TPA: GNAT family N-acetyltransferase [Solirubrobacteraceae bacterium]|nr:GNAT family N-acetyltransferase [Solirubrobacteraceae bacterium]